MRFVGPTERPLIGIICHFFDIPKQNPSLNEWDIQLFALHPDHFEAPWRSSVARWSPSTSLGASAFWRLRISQLCRFGQSGAGGCFGAAVFVANSRKNTYKLKTPIYKCKQRTKTCASLSPFRRVSVLAWQKCSSPNWKRDVSLKETTTLSQQPVAGFVAWTWWLLGESKINSGSQVLLSFFTEGWIQYGNSNKCKMAGVVVFSCSLSVWGVSIGSPTHPYPMFYVEAHGAECLFVLSGIPNVKWFLKNHGYPFNNFRQPQIILQTTWQQQTAITTKKTKTGKTMQNLLHTLLGYDASTRNHVQH